MELFSLSLAVHFASRQSLNCPVATPATKSPAQKGRGSTERSGWGSSANSNLKEHFSGLQMVSE